MILANLIMEEFKPNKMIKAYKESFRKFGVSPSSLLIPKGRQEIRFESFLPYVKKNSTLLDFGCGFSDFAQFLVECGIDTISITPDAVFKTYKAINEVELTLNAL